jgi:transcriptional regulator with XRE-family HTH domain
MANTRDALRRRRTHLGFTQESLSEALGVATTTYRDWERGVAVPRPACRPDLARILKVTLADVARWFDEDDDRAVAPDGVSVPAWLGHFASLEQGAAALWTFEPMVVPGLLQTGDYATAVERHGPDQIGEAEMRSRVDMRLARQEVLRRDPDPLVLTAVIDESVLHRIAGDGEIMADQLDHLVVVAAMPTVDLRVLPLDSGAFSASFGTFTLLTSSGADRPYMACVLDRGGPHYLDRPHDIEGHVRLSRYLQDVALSPRASIDLIRAVSKERYQ